MMIRRSPGSTETAEGARSAAARLTDFLRRRLHDEAVVRELVAASGREPAPDTAQRLAALLEQEALRDPAFDAEFRARFAQVQAVVANHSGTVTNAVSGNVTGSVVQARDVHGGISFGEGVGRA